MQLERFSDPDLIMFEWGMEMHWERSACFDCFSLNYFYKQLKFFWILLNDRLSNGESEWFRKQVSLASLRNTSIVQDIPS